MLKRYSIYIAKNLVWSGLLITLSLTSIVWLTQALRHIDFIVNRGVSLDTFLYLAVLLLPSLLLMILPVAMFAATVFTYTRLQGDSELIVLRAAGLSAWQLARPAIGIAAAVTVLGYVLSLYVLPATYRQFKDLQNFLRDNYASLLLQEEVFNSPVDGLTVFIRSRDKNGILKGILVHDSRNEKVPVTMMAQEGKLIQTSKGPRFILGHGNRQENNDGRLSLLNFDSYTLDISFFAEQAASRVREPEERYLPELLNQKDLSAAQQAEMLAEAHQRLTWPFFSMVITMIAASFMLTGEFNRRGQWKRVAASVVVALILIFTAFGIKSSVSKHVEFAALYYVHLAAGIGLSAYMLSNPYAFSWRPGLRKRPV